MNSKCRREISVLCTGSGHRGKKWHRITWIVTNWNKWFLIGDMSVYGGQRQKVREKRKIWKYKLNVVGQKERDWGKLTAFKDKDAVHCLSSYDFYSLSRSLDMGFYFFTSVCACLACMFTYVGKCVCMWKSEADVECLSWLASTLFIKAGFLIWPQRSHIHLF